jgi:CDP-4-dehydro-6-deoxyglucose reductase
MSFKITILPSGREFFAEARETVLDAALRSGVALSYNCNNGTCGECKARVVSGEIGEVQFHDYTLTEAEKLQNYTLLCSTYPGSDMVLEAEEAAGTHEIPLQSIRARVAKLERLGEDYLILHLRTPRTRTLRFFAGQYVRLEEPSEEARELAVASCPCNGRDLEFHLQRDRRDSFSRRVFEHWSVGQTIGLTGPYGEFTLNERSRRPLLLVAEGTGFAPIKSIVEHAIALDLPQRMWLFWFVRRTGSHYLANFCRSLEYALDDFRYRPVALSAESDEDDTVAAALADLNDVAGCDLYVSAGGRLTATVIEALVRRGLKRTRMAVYPHRFGGG